MAIDWTVLTPSEFEELCYALVETNGFQELQWYGKGGGDKGRDIIAKRETAYTDRMRVVERWVVQCKRYTAEPPGVAEISKFLEQCREHKPDNVLIIVSNTLSSNTKDWIEAVRSEYKFRIHLWEEMDLVRELKAHRGNLSANFSEILKQSAFRSPALVRFWPVQMSPVYYRCDYDEFEEMGFFIINDYGHEGNVQWLTRFIEYLRDHRIEFVGPEEV
ncbi:MAG: restriction endonuclease [Anaerolineales bacterium]|nr:restriction endonuclease [Anaerolineales bacterium]